MLKGRKARTRHDRTTWLEDKAKKKQGDREKQGEKGKS